MVSLFSLGLVIFVSPCIYASTVSPLLHLWSGDWAIVYCFCFLCASLLMNYELGLDIFLHDCRLLI
ncbi:hypothetical protein Lalb_Chr00c36g0408861 [Lupinus albus]|uniref:Uncharacterized protein n=1 Tax=Lupinus albus TaxID=3870 RepID=A0A6A4NC35_LUPAL|nr:hypothetical protein Lalb_Chr00c36g0408861 [Lupinus albus]